MTAEAVGSVLFGLRKIATIIRLIFSSPFTWYIGYEPTLYLSIVAYSPLQTCTDILL